MDLIPVKSDNVARMGHDVETGQCRVEFKNGRAYEYDNVSAEEFETVLRAKSVGSAFHRVIKTVKTCRPVELSKAASE